jgi:hypothetical protein
MYLLYQTISDILVLTGIGVIDSAASTLQFWSGVAVGAAQVPNWSLFLRRQQE